MAYDEGLAHRIRDIVVDYPTIAEKKMFGGIAFMYRDYMFCGVIDGRLIARVGSDNYADSLARPHVEKMDFTEREMKGYVYVDAIGIEEDEDLVDWVTLCADFVQSLPPKKPK